MMGGKHSVVAMFVADGTEKSWKCHGKLHHMLEYRIDYEFGESIMGLAKNQPKSLMNDYHAVLW